MVTKLIVDFNHDGPPDPAETTLPMSMEEFRDMRSMEGIPIFAQQMLALRACGFSPKAIAAAFSRSVQQVTSYLQQYDPLRKFTLSGEAKRSFLAQMVEARAGEALLYITSEKMKNSSATDLISIASKCIDVLKALAVKDRNEKPININEAIDKLKVVSGGK